MTPRIRDIKDRIKDGTYQDKAPEALDAVVDGVLADALGLRDKADHLAGRLMRRKSHVDRVTDIATSLQEACEDAVTMWAWWKDGVQQVGTCGTTLAEAKEIIARSAKGEYE